MQKLPEVPNRKKGRRMRTRKKASSWQRGLVILSLSSSDQRTDNLVLACLGTTHTSLDVALVSPFHPVAALSRSTLCWYIQHPQVNYKLTLPDFSPVRLVYSSVVGVVFQKKTNPYGSPKYQMRTSTYMKRINVFLTP